ncbi:MAG TPA: glycosyltransferase family 2 protein [Ignavibacteria bacterium]|jgi:hypothetical protein
MDLSIIIVNYDVFEDVTKCISSINETIKNLSYEIFVVDNNSSDRSIERIDKLFLNVHLINLNENRGFGQANNAAVVHAAGKYLLFVNPDIIFLENTINRLYFYLESNSSAGCAGPLIIRPDNKIQYYYTFFPSAYSRLMQEFGFYERAPAMKRRKYDFINKNIKYGNPFLVDWVLGACMLMPRQIFNRLGGFDESFFLYEEEVDLLYRMKKEGFDTYILPDVKVIHNHNTATSKLGFAFIRYHGFRSVIIYSNKHDRNIKKFFSKLLLSFGVILRFFRGIILTKYKLGNIRTHTYLFWDLFKLNLAKMDNTEKMNSNFKKAQEALSGRT